MVPRQALHTGILPDTHLAVHDIRALEAAQQVSHLQEGLSVTLHHTVVGRHEARQGVTLQTLKTQLLILRELLQDSPLTASLETPCGGNGADC